MKYKFIKDYTSKFGVVKAGQELTGKKITVPLVLPNSKIPQQVPSVVLIFDKNTGHPYANTSVSSDNTASTKPLLHKSEQVVIDFEYLYKYIKTGGFIFLHDTYPCMIENLKPSACNDCYLSPIIIKQKYPLLEMLTLPINPGLTIIRKK